MKRYVTLLLAVSVAFGLFTGCGAREKDEAYVPTGDALIMSDDDLATMEPEKEPQDLTLAYDPTRSMNPLLGNNITNRVLFSLIYQGLFAVSSENEPFPILCSHYQVSSDNRVYTYYIDRNARFSDGSPVTADDVLATYLFAKSGDCLYYKGRFVHVESVEKVADEGLGEEGVKFTLNTAYQDFSMLLDVPILKASEIASQYPAGTGPYVFHDNAGKWTLTRNPSWWSEQEIPVRALTIKLIEIHDQSTFRDEFEFGDVGLAVANPLSDSFAEYRCDYELWNVDNGYFMYLAFNIQYSDYFKKDKNLALRQNMTYAINREKIIEENFRGMAYPATLPGSPGSPYYNQSLAERYKYDDLKFLEKTNGFEPLKDDKHQVKKLRLLVNCDDSARLRTARDIAHALTEMGIPTGTLEYGAKDKYDFEAVLRSHNWDIYLGKTRLSPNMDLTPFFKGYGNLWFGGLTSDKIYGMCRETLADRGNYYNLHQMIVDDGRVVPILFGYDAVYAKRGEFDGLAPARDNVFFYTRGKTMEDIRVQSLIS